VELLTSDAPGGGTFNFPAALVRAEVVVIEHLFRSFSVSLVAAAVASSFQVRIKKGGIKNVVNVMNE